VGVFKWELMEIAHNANKTLSQRMVEARELKENTEKQPAAFVGDNPHWNPSKMPFCFLPLFVFFLTAILPLQAATKEEYLKAIDNWVSHDMGGRWEKMVKSVLSAPNPPPDGKFAMCGRGEFDDALPVALAGVYHLNNGDEAGEKKFLNNALRIIQTANKVTVDGYDEDKLEDGTSRGQLCFAFRDVVDACRILKEQGVLKGNELERTRTMMEKIIAYRMKLMPQPGMGGLSNHMNNYALGVLMGANFLEEELHSDPVFAKARPDLPAKLEPMRVWSSLPLKSGINYPYHYRLQPDGTVSQPIRELDHGRLDEHPVINQPPRFGINEDSSGYDAASVYELLRLMEEMPLKYVPELTDARRKEACDWMMDWSRHVMPVGVFPSFSDSQWGSWGLWIAAFEEAAHQFKDTAKYGGAAAHFRDCAERIFRYDQAAGQGKNVDEVFNALPVTEEAIKPVGIIQTSVVIRQQSPEGEWIPSKVILLGEATKRSDAPFVMFNTFHNGSHSHGAIGGIITYGSDGSVFLHETGYDAGPMFFHDLFIVRPVNERFLPFAKVFTNPKETVLEKNKTGLGNIGRKLVSADITDFPDYSYAKIVTLVDWGRVREALQLTREAILEKKTGALIVFDTVTGKIKTDSYVCGPLWHVQNILSKTDQGFLCQDDVQEIIEPHSPTPMVIASPAKPVWIGMAGPKGSTLGSEEWHFLCRHGHNDAPEKNHLYLACNGLPHSGGTVATLTVFVPMHRGITNMTTPPALLLVDGGAGIVTIGKHTYRFDEKGVESSPQDKADNRNLSPAHWSVASSNADTLKGRESERGNGRTN